MEQRGLFGKQVSSWLAGEQSRGDTISHSALLQRRIPSSFAVSALPTQTTTIVPTLQSYSTLTDSSNQTPTLSPSTIPNDTTPDINTLYPNNSVDMTYYIVVAMISAALFVWIAYVCWYHRKRELQAEQVTREVEAAFVNGESPTGDSGSEVDTRRHNPRQKELKAAIDQLFPVRTFGGTTVIHMEHASSENIGHFKIEKENIPNVMGETFEIEEIDEITDIVEEEKSRCDKNSKDELGDKESDTVQITIGKYEGQNAIDISLNPLETIETKIAAPLVPVKSGFSLSPTFFDNNEDDAKTIVVIDDLDTLPLPTSSSVAVTFPSLTNAPDSPSTAAEISIATQAPSPSSTVHLLRDGDPCTICLDHWLEGDLIRNLPCSHQFHARCLDPWFLGIELVCPNCKRNYEPALRENILASAQDSAPLVHTASEGAGSLWRLLFPSLNEVAGLWVRALLTIYLLKLHILQCQ
ncbi:hypothetical protein BC937DRAFT_88471 [Endogone sp. FLAS-F59071]|nr:hypothetical protein BC937DRAFT_88471 [Endogone sp. FLAS-F59071]|eukprot:RUS18669.1 hypothetical protein BC937DRAFT_88471 [Endogone sp. FLAS-F59071]